MASKGKQNVDQDEDRFANTDIQIERKGAKIILPSDPHEMSYDEGILALKRKKKEEETFMNVYEIVHAYPLDGALALQKALSRIYGWATAKPGSFFTAPPTTVGLETGVGETTQVIWGTFEIPGIEGYVQTSVGQEDGRMVFLIGGEVKKKDMPQVKKIAELTRKIVREESVYRGKAIHLRVNNDGLLDTNNPPKFLDLSRVNREELVFSDHTMTQINTNLFTPITRTEVCRQNRVPLKRGVLLSGTYGTGKTLTAFVAAQLCEENGWTFILIDKVKGLSEAINFAKQYQPALIFAEDIDRAVAGDNRTVEIDDVLNTIDGIGSKGSEIMTVLTTNHVKDINQAMLRPGRLDAVITVEAPDAVAAQKLVRMYGRGLIDANEDLTEAGLELAGHIPAVIREVVERSKLYAISQTEPGEKLRVTGKAIADAARGMKDHLALLAEKTEQPKTAVELLGEAMAEIVGMKVAESDLMNRTHKTAVSIANEVGAQAA